MFRFIRIRQHRYKYQQHKCFHLQFYKQDSDGESRTRSRSAMKKIVKKRKMEASVARSQSAAAHRSKSLNTPRDKSGFKDPDEREKAKKKAKLGQRKMNYMGKAGMLAFTCMKVSTCLNNICHFENILSTI